MWSGSFAKDKRIVCFNGNSMFLLVFLPECYHLIFFFKPASTLIYSYKIGDLFFGGRAHKLIIICFAL